jgi:hypothetical protein
MTAVRNDCGLKRPGSQTALGRLRSNDHSYNYLILSAKLAIQAGNDFSDG